MAPRLRRVSGRDTREAGRASRVPGPHSRKSEKRRGGVKRAGRRENPKTRRLREEAVQRSDADKAFIATLASGGDTVVSLNGAECGVPVKVSGRCGN